MAKFQIALTEKPRHMLRAPRDFWILLNGARVGDAYYNMTGYRCGIPMPGGGTFDPGEISQSKLRQEIADMNRLGRTLLARGLNEQEMREHLAGEGFSLAAAQRAMPGPRAAAACIGAGPVASPDAAPEAAAAPSF